MLGCYDSCRHPFLPTKNHSSLHGIGRYEQHNDEQTFCTPGSVEWARGVMKHLYYFSVIFIITLSGCAMHHPQNAEEFRAGVLESSWTEVDSFEVKRPYKQVVSTFDKYTEKCLSKAIETTSCSNYGCNSYVQTYTPTLIANNAKMEMHIQLNMSNMVNISTTSEIPENGIYVLVTDAYPVNKNTTKVDMYQGKMGYATLKKAVKGWATGKVKGCPDLTKG